MARKPKSLTREQMQSRKDKAVRFTRGVVGDPERAEEIERESLDEYADRRHIQLSNPCNASERRNVMGKTIEDYRDEIADLKSTVAELEDENEDLQDQLDQITDIVSPDDDDDDSNGDADED